MGAGPEIRIKAFAFAAPPPLTVIVKKKVPKASGIPEIVPVRGFNVRPGGKLPAVIEKVYGGVPPDATQVCE
jgi:hypothetical protein